MDKNLERLMESYKTDFENGLSSLDVEKSRKRYGANTLKEKKKQNLFVRFLLEFKDILIIILLLAAVISVIVDPKEFVDSIIILVVVIVNAILGLFQENKAEKSLEALKKLTINKAKVYRDGSLKTIDSTELVCGDIIYAEAGDSISADSIIIESSNLRVLESALTGESVSVEKDNEYVSEDLPLGDRKNTLFSGTYITNGHAKAIVVNVGMNTEIGKIASMLDNDNQALTPLQNKLKSVGAMIGILALIICFVVFILEMIGSNDWSNPLSYINSFKSAVALAVAAIPEGLATVVTIVLAIGVSKMSKENAIIKRLPAVETLGSTNVVCSDKTGTLTQNKMTVLKLYDKINYSNVEEFNNKKLISYFAICCDAKIDNDGNRIGDPTELALIDMNNKYGLDISKINKVLDYPFDSERKLMTTVIKENNKYIAITKGALDSLIDKCINPNYEKNKAIEINEMMSNNALRVLALGIKYYDYLPSILELENNIEFLGLVGMIDPARDEVKESISLASNAGIKTVMITGDHIITAKAIAKDLGIMKENDKAITSDELSKLDDEFLTNHISEYSVFARVAPKDKVRIVEAWQKNGAIVAMTGDGVNDAPALKKADIGCAMGITGTDVSKEAADMILTDDNFSTIIKAVKEGRGVYRNIQNCVKYLLSSNIGEVFTIFIASLVQALGYNLGIPLLPIHLLWINLVTDSLPAFGIAMEEIDNEVMDLKPRGKNESFFSNGLGLKIAIEGFIIGTCSLASYIIGHFIFKNEEVAQTMAFLTLSSTQLFHAYNVKSNHTIFRKESFKNKFMNFAFIVGFILQFFVIYCPYVNTIFNLSPLSIIQLFISLFLALVIVIIIEISKRTRAK